MKKKIARRQPSSPYELMRNDPVISLFDNYRLGDMLLTNRIVMVPAATVMGPLRGGSCKGHGTT